MELRPAIALRSSGPSTLALVGTVSPAPSHWSGFEDSHLVEWQEAGNQKCTWMINSLMEGYVQRRVGRFVQDQRVCQKVAKIWATRFSLFQPLLRTDLDKIRRRTRSRSYEHDGCPLVAKFEIAPRWTSPHPISLLNLKVHGRSSSRASFGTWRNR